MSISTISKRITLNEDDVNWYERTHTGTPLSITLSLLLSKYREVLDKTPEEYAAIAARELAEEMGNGE